VNNPPILPTILNQLQKNNRNPTPSTDPFRRTLAPTTSPIAIIACPPLIISDTSYHVSRAGFLACKHAYVPTNTAEFQKHSPLQVATSAQ